MMLGGSCACHFNSTRGDEWYQNQNSRPLAYRTLFNMAGDAMLLWHY